MDPLAHTLAGAALGETRLNRLSPLARAALIVGANLPDVDVLAYVRGEDFAFGFRRGVTHGPLGLVLLPIAWTAVLLAWDRALRSDRPRAQAARLLALTFLAALTHPFLDWLNTYGIRLLAPFDERWFYGDAVFIVDPWIWLALGAGVFLARRPRGLELGGLWAPAALLATVVVAAGAFGPAPHWVLLVWLGALALVAVVARSHPGERATLVGLGMTALYIALMVGSALALRGRVARELDERGIPFTRLMVAPLPGNPLARDVLVEEPGRYRWGRLALTEPGLRLADETIELGPCSPAEEIALDRPEIAGTLSWMRFPWTRVAALERGLRVEVLDARYVRQPSAGFGAVAVDLPSGLASPPSRETSARARRSYCSGRL